jgi:YegS/Rv2252/BmrU family lipid kinase
MLRFAPRDMRAMSTNARAHARLGVRRRTDGAMSIAVIINPVAGNVAPDRARRFAEVAAAVLATLGEQSEISVTERPGHARELAVAAVARGARVVFAWGGDGTVNEVGTALAFGPAALGIVPSGSGNGLARSLDIARRPEQALAEAVGATPRRIDVGELGGRRFLNVAGVGFDAAVARGFARRARRSGGWWGYARVAAQEMLTYRPQAYRITAPGGVTACRALLVTFANSPEYGNGARIAPGARVDDGWLELVTIEARSSARMLWAAPRLFTGGIGRVAGVTISRIRTATIEGEGPLLFHVDGDAVQGGDRLEARVHPAALAVCVR